jgi:hypothetical protein
MFKEPYFNRQLLEQYFLKSYRNFFHILGFPEFKIIFTLVVYSIFKWLIQY